MASNGYGHSPDAMDIDEPPVHGTKSAEEWPDAPLDRGDFYRDLQSFHLSRGTNLDPNPRVHGRPVDLYDLFYNIEGRGGYDKVSAEKLLWRKIAAEFELAGGHAAASAFQIKTVYYKNLAAYAIKRVHKQDPPPKEILEALTAKGSDLLSRTVHNFRTPRKLDNANGIPSAGGGDEDGSESDHRGTPLGDSMDSYHGGRALRQAPAQRPFLHPDLTINRQRQQTHLAVPPVYPSQTAAGYSPTNAALNAGGTTFTAAKYETRTFPLSLQPVPTQSNSLESFQDKVRRIREAEMAKVGRLPEPKPQFIAPGTGSPGPNIYFRALMALRSGVLEEQLYAMPHLVKMSHERGDKFKLEAFVGFAEGLLGKALEITSLFFDEAWEVSYTKGEELDRNNVLDGIDGTPDILERISKLQELHIDDGLETAEFHQTLKMCIEAVLVIRNLSLLPENAKYIAEDYPLAKDLLVILLNLPHRHLLVELKNDALVIAAELTPYLWLEADDPLYLTLIKYVAQRDDRGSVVHALRAICRISLQLEETNRLQDFPVDILETMTQWCMLEDEELVATCLDFFYQFTALQENVALLLTAHKEDKLDLQSFVQQVARLLLYNAQDMTLKREISPAKTVPPATEIPQIPQDLLEQIINIAEPERSSVWLKCCFEEEKDSEMTQISLWQAYQNRFQYFTASASKPMLAAADFIKRISETFKSTSAQVLQNQTPPKFIIKGIRPRRRPLDLKGRSYEACLWTEPGSKTVCGTWTVNPEKLYEHIATQHLGMTRDAKGAWDIVAAQDHWQKNSSKLSCCWAGCDGFDASTSTENPMALGRHIQTHLPAVEGGSRKPSPFACRKEDRAAVRDYFEKHLDLAEPAKHMEMSFKNTASRDLPGGDVEAEGLPVTAVLILRNLALNIPKVGGTETRTWFQLLIRPIMSQLLHVMSSNLPMMKDVFVLIGTIDNGDPNTSLIYVPS